MTPGSRTSAMTGVAGKNQDMR